MLVFSKARLVFLSVPKTGTTAYQAALAPHASLIVTDPPELKHAPVFRYNRFFRPMLEKFVDQELDVMAVMREPISWLGSWYRYRRRPSQHSMRTSTHRVSFDEFVQAYLKGNRPAFANVGSQAKFLEPQKNGTHVTHLFRYEDQEGVRSFLNARLGVSVDTDTRNTSPQIPLELTTDTETRLRRKFAHEFGLWNGIGPGGSYDPLPREVTAGS